MSGRDGAAGAGRPPSSWVRRAQARLSCVVASLGLLLPAACNRSGAYTPKPLQHDPQLPATADGLGPWRFGMARAAVEQQAACRSWGPAGVAANGGGPVAPREAGVAAPEQLQCADYRPAGRAHRVGFGFDGGQLAQLALWWHEGASRAQMFAMARDALTRLAAIYSIHPSQTTFARDWLAREEQRSTRHLEERGIALDVHTPKPRPALTLWLGTAPSSQRYVVRLVLAPRPYEHPTFQ